MKLEDIKKYFEDNKDDAGVKTFLEGLGTTKKPTLADIKTFVESDDEGKRWLQSTLDTKVTKGIDTWKTNNLQKEIDEEINKRFPNESPESKKLKQLESELAQERNARKREALKNKALSVATEKKLPTDLIDYLLGDDEDATMSNLTKLETVFQTRLQEAVEEKFKQSGRNIDKGKGGKTFTREQINAMSEKEINENWDAIQEAMAGGSL